MSATTPLSTATTTTPTLSGEFKRLATTDQRYETVFSSHPGGDSIAFNAQVFDRTTGKFEGAGLYSDNIRTGVNSPEFHNATRLDYNPATRQLTAVINGETKALSIRPSTPAQDNPDLSFQIIRQGTQDIVKVTNQYNGFVYFYAYAQGSIDRVILKNGILAVDLKNDTVDVILNIFASNPALVSDALGSKFNLAGKSVDSLGTFPNALYEIVLTTENPSLRRVVILSDQSRPAGIITEYQMETPVPAPTNSNFEFQIVEKGTGEKDVFLKNRRTGESQFFTTVLPEENYETKIGPVDVNPEGTFAFINIQRNYTGPLGTSSIALKKGTTLLFDIAKKTLVEPELINDLTGTSLGKGSIPGPLPNSSSYRFVKGLLLLNGLGTTFTGHTIFDNFDPFVIRLDSASPRATRLSSQQAIYLQKEIVFTPQGDKLLFGATERSNDSLAIYDMATGKISYRGVATTGFGGIMAVSPDGNTAIVGSPVNAVYIMPVRNLTQMTQTISSLDSQLIQAKFLDPQTADLTVQSGKHYLLNVQTLALSGPFSVQVIPQLTGFYGGAIPQGAAIANVLTVKDSLGKTIGWNFTVTLNSSTTAGVIQNQLLTIRLVGTRWVVNKVLDRDHANTLIATAIFSYNATTALLQSIARYNRLGVFISTTICPPARGRNAFLCMKS